MQSETINAALFQHKSKRKQNVSPDDEHNMLEICRELEINKYIEKNLCIKLDNYQELVRSKPANRNSTLAIICLRYLDFIYSSSFKL